MHAAIAGRLAPEAGSMQIRKARDIRALGIEALIRGGDADVEIRSWILR